jgi:hypothetical protein
VLLTLRWRPVPPLILAGAMAGHLAIDCLFGGDCA